MRAIIIEEKDALALLADLKLVALEKNNIWGPTNEHLAQTDWDSMHRAFHYVVVRWLQEQGATCVR